jgi:F0F1-type ATP synthase assembly protein I
MMFATACFNSSDPPPGNQDNKLQHQLEQAQKEAKQTQAQLDITQQEMEEIRMKAEFVKQHASFLIGVLLSGIIVSLIIGIALGSKARRDSLQQKEDDMHDQTHSED